ncbi:MAG: leucine-rich repeat domain-containing protein [Bdellovibrionia bacterium]
MHPTPVGAMEYDPDAIEIVDPIEITGNEMEDLLRGRRNLGFISISCKHDPWHVDGFILGKWIEKGLLDNYQTLSFDDCDIKQLPTNLHLLSGLKILNIQNSNLESLDNISDLKNLIRLSAKDNRIKVIPDELGNLPHLKSLNLSNNLIKSIPAQVLKLHKEQMVDMNLQNNPLEKPTEIFSITPESVSEMARHLDPASPQYKHDFDRVLSDPRADMSAFIKTPGLGWIYFWDLIMSAGQPPLPKGRSLREKS